MWNPLMQDPLLGPMVHGLGLGILFPFIFLIFIVWVFAWKALALWHAGRNGQRVWFVVLLLVNTVGILEIVYLKWFQKNVVEGNRNELFPFIKNVRKAVAAKMPSPAPETTPKPEEKKEESKAE